MARRSVIPLPWKRHTQIHTRWPPPPSSQRARRRIGLEGGTAEDFESQRGRLRRRWELDWFLDNLLAHTTMDVVDIESRRPRIPAGTEAQWDVAHAQERLSLLHDPTLLIVLISLLSGPSELLHACSYWPSFSFPDLTGVDTLHPLTVLL